MATWGLAGWNRRGGLRARRGCASTPAMPSRDDIFFRILELIGPLNARAVPLAEGTRFNADLDFDSLTVMDLVASIEDEWEITLPINMLPELETVGGLTDAVAKLVATG